MTQARENDYAKELRVLLRLMRSAPSRDWSRERERVVVLTNLLTGGRRAHAI